MNFKKGDFVMVGNDIGVVVFLEEELFEDHIGVWYGEKSQSNTPKYKTVSKEYCKLISEVEEYH